MSTAKAPAAPSDRICEKIMRYPYMVKCDHKWVLSQMCEIACFNHHTLFHHLKGIRVAYRFCKKNPD